MELLADDCVLSDMHRIAQALSPVAENEEILLIDDCADFLLFCGRLPSSSGQVPRDRFVDLAEIAEKCVSLSSNGIDLTHGLN